MPPRLERSNSGGFGASGSVSLVARRTRGKACSDQTMCSDVREPSSGAMKSQSPTCGEFGRADQLAALWPTTLQQSAAVGSELPIAQQIFGGEVGRLEVEHVSPI